MRHTNPQVSSTSKYNPYALAPFFFLYYSQTLADLSIKRSPTEKIPVSMNFSGRFSFDASIIRRQPILAASASIQNLAATSQSSTNYIKFI